MGWGVRERPLPFTSPWDPLLFYMESLSKAMMQI